jgi:hypothetical protein
MELIITARSKEQGNTEYLSLREHGISDRLSHPVALVYDTGKVYGFCGSPYFISSNGIKQQWKPEIEGVFYQYAGYTCSLSKGTVGYTLGYENASLLFVKSHDVRERASLSNNCFEVEPGETVEFTLYLYEFDYDKEFNHGKKGWMSEQFLPGPFFMFRK